MKIKDRIALFFTLISTTMLLMVLCVVYFTFMKFLEADFFERLTDRTMVTATLYLEADEISRDDLDVVRQKYLQKLNGEVIRIYDEKDRATFIGDSTQYWTKSIIDKVRQKKHLKYDDGEKQVVGIYYKDNQGDFVILAAAADFGSHKRLGKLLKIMLFSFLIISVIILLLSRWVAEKMLQPLHRFAQEVKQIGFQNMAFRVKEQSKKDEINLITQSFNHLMEELEQAFILQKTFVANASHELRTPVTRMMMTAELALSKERNPQDYKLAIQSLLEDSEKMNEIISALLALAKVDLTLTNAHFSPLRLDQLMEKIATGWHYKKLPLKTDFPKTTIKQPEVLANAVLLQIALDNLLANAFKFSNNQEVGCTLEVLKENYLITIKDTGVGIHEADLTEVFKPFFTQSNQIGEAGEGMGLYLAQKIISLHHGIINVASVKNQGTVFTVRLPKL